MVIPHRRRFATGGLVVALGCAAAVAFAQGKPAATYDEWRLIEPTQELSSYRTQLREGAFGDEEKNFLVQVALPQLGMPKNRPLIDRWRKRMGDVLCSDKSYDPKAAAAAMKTATDFMVAAARDADADTVLRVNAALFIGELRGPGSKPWPQAATSLAALLGEDALPPAVRIAAAAGLVRQVDADPQARAADVGPTLLKVVAAPLDGVDPVAAGWLRERSLAMLARMGNAAPNGTAAAAARLLSDASRPCDLRVRAAATTGACIKAAGDIDAAAAVTAIEELARAALKATKAEVERRELAARRGADTPAQPRPGAAPAAAGGDAPQLFRRDAWRLATLADALAPATGGGGLARFAGGRAAAATVMAQALRNGAVGLDTHADADALAEALVFLGEPGTAAVNAPTTPAAAAEPAPAAPAAGGDAAPFGT